MMQKYKILGLLFFTSIVITAQTINEGELTVLQNTQVSIVESFDNTFTASLMNDGELFIYSNFNNDGLVSYFDAINDGLTRFEGTNVQQITGDQLSEFYNVLFNNTSVQNPFELRGDISIVNQASFIEGILQNDEFGGSISFEKLADHINTSDDSHVDGEVQKNGDTAFEFPIGDNGFYRKSVISVPDDASDIFTSKYFLENSNTMYPHNLTAGVIELINNTEYWTINREQGNSNIVLTLEWDTNTTPIEITTDPTSSLHIVRWDANQGFWVDEGGIVDDLNQTVTTITNVSGYGVFTLARVKEELFLPGDIVIYNAVTPNGDGDNDFFFIDGIDNYPNNSVQIFNRWGVKVFETSGYNESNNVFTGVSDGSNKQLPTGTYFYTIQYNIENQTIKKAGYLYINKDNN